MGLVFAATVYKETLPAIVDARNAPSLRLRLFPSSQASHTRSASLLSDASAETLVGSPTADKGSGSFTASPVESLDPDREALLHSQPTPPPKWTFKALLRHRPVQVSSLTLFINQFVSSGWSAVSLLFFYDRSQ